MAAVQPSEPDDRAATLGVLFVHGMGASTQGATLRDFGDPLVEWLTNGNVGLASVELTLEELSPGQDATAHRCYRLTTEGGDERTLLLAESWWSKSFTAATYAGMAFWLLASVPWMLGEYMRNALRHERGRASYPVFRIFRLILIPTYAIFGTILAGPIVLLLVMLLGARLIPRRPLPCVRKLAEKIPGVLAESLGDVFVILNSDVDRAQIRDRIVRDHTWLQQRCERTVVVAHSAGAALTHGLLRDGELPGGGTYVSLGEAIWRMAWMQKISALRARRIVAIAVAVCGTFSITIGWIMLAGIEPPDGAALSPSSTSAGAGAIFVGLVLHVVSALMVWRVAATADAERMKAIEDLDGKLAIWHDYVASSDPVPAGALTERAHATSPLGRAASGAAEAPQSPYRPAGARNRRSTFLDHTSYTDNLEDFVAGLGCDLAAAGAGIQLTITRAELAPHQDARRLRTLSLALLRLGSASVGAVVVAAVLSDGGFDRYGLPGFAGFLAAVVMLGASWWLAGRSWRRWDAADRERFLARAPIDATRRPQLAVAVWWTLFSAIAAGAVLWAADTTAPGWIAATAIALAAGCSLLINVRALADFRDELYSSR